MVVFGEYNITSYIPIFIVNHSKLRQKIEKQVDLERGN